MDAALKQAAAHARNPVLHGRSGRQSLSWIRDLAPEQKCLVAPDHWLLPPPAVTLSQGGPPPLISTTLATLANGSSKTPSTSWGRTGSTSATVMHAEGSHTLFYKTPF